MSTSIQSLQVLLERAERERDAALSVFQSAQNRAQAAQAQAEQLTDYRGDYQRRWSGTFAQAGGTIQIVHAYQGFRERLEMAVSQQDRVASHAATQSERAREALQACELRVASVKKLIERRLAEARLAAERRDQKQTDEAAQRAAWRRAAESAN
jgi:flagellar FliJ protein